MSNIVDKHAIIPINMLSIQNGAILLINMLNIQNGDYNQLVPRTHSGIICNREITELPSMMTILRFLLITT